MKILLIILITTSLSLSHANAQTMFGECKSERSGKELMINLIQSIDAARMCSFSEAEKMLNSPESATVVANVAITTCEKKFVTAARNLCLSSYNTNLKLINNDPTLIGYLNETSFDGLDKIKSKVMGDLKSHIMKERINLN